jgi:uncharacterized protein YjbI with pentapeptide repeats
MVSWFPSFWQKVKKPLKIVGIILVCLLGGALIVSVIGGYIFDWTWTGFGPFTPPTSDYQRGVTLYEWLQLAVVPAAIAFGVVGLSRLQQQHDQRLAEQRADSEQEAAKKRAEIEQNIADGNQHEASLKEYYHVMSELLLHENLRKSDEDAEVRNIARVWTLTALRRLDDRRKKSVLEFLYSSDLITKERVIVDLGGAYLEESLLFGVFLVRANLSGAILSGAHLNHAILTGAELVQTDLSLAILRDANLDVASLNQAGMIDADLSSATLQGATLLGTDLTRADLSGARLQRANLTLAILNEADLTRADLSEANLTKASLAGANLQGANLTGADLSGADLSDADVTDEQLAKAKSLKGATMPNGSKYQK